MIFSKTQVSQYQVACAVGEVSNGKLVTNLSALCGSSKINKWAKYKPVRYNFTANRPTYWWKAVDGMCGLSVATYQVSQMSSVMTAIENGITWEYLPPRGGTAEPYRLNDFAGYNTDAMFPLHEPIIPGTIYATSGTMQVNTDWEANADDTVLNITDISDFSNYYFGALMKMVGTSSYVWMTSSSKISADQAISVDLPLAWTTAGYSYDIYCFLCSASKTSTEAGDPVGTIVPLPFPVKRFKIQRSAYQTYVYAQQTASGSSVVSYMASVKNTGTSSSSFNTTVSVIFMRRLDDTVVYTDKRYVSFKLTAGQTYTIIDNATVDLADKPGFTGVNWLNQDFKVMFVSENDYLNYGEFDIDMASD